MTNTLTVEHDTVDEKTTHSIYIINVGTTRVAYCEYCDDKVLEEITALSENYENGVLVETCVNETCGLVPVGNISLDKAFRETPTTKITKGRKTLLDALNAYAPTIKGENKFVLVSQGQAIMTIGWNNNENTWEDCAVAHTPYGQITFSIVEEGNNVFIISENIFESVLICSFLRNCGITAQPQAS